MYTAENEPAKNLQNFANVANVGNFVNHPGYGDGGVRDLGAAAREEVDALDEVAGDGHGHVDLRGRRSGEAARVVAASMLLLPANFKRARSRLYRSQILYTFESSRRDLHNALLCTALKSHFF